MTRDGSASLSPSGGARLLSVELAMDGAEEAEEDGEDDGEPEAKRAKTEE